MDLPLFPKNCPIDETAVIFDQSTLECIDFEDFAGTLPIYCARQFLDKYDTQFFNLLRGIFPRKIRELRELETKSPSREKYERIALLVSEIDDTSLRTATKRSLEQQLHFSEHFHVGEGNIVDLDDEDDILAARTNAYLSEIQTFIHLIPKFFVEQLQQEHSSSLTVQQVEARYIQLLNEVDPQHKVNQKARKELYKYVRFQCTKKRHSTPEGIKEDASLVALACSLPARQVMLYSRDGDIKDLALLTDCLIGTPHPITVISHKDEYKYKH
ncbi:MAG: hypothetical protein AABX37_01150 [Nanoarchaeota archaeon]